MLPCISVRSQILTWFPRRFAGHSKWANIRHTKAAKDGQRSLMFVKFCQRIRVAIQEGGSSNPEHNMYLAQAVEVARKNHMPVASIQNCIKSSQADAAKSKPVLFEVRGPKGSVFIISTFTDNPKKTQFTISPILKRAKVPVALNDKISRHVFSHKGLIEAKPPDVIQNPSEAVIDHAIEVGAEEVIPSEVEENYFQFICSVEQMNKVKGELIKLNYDIKSSDFEYIPSLKVPLEEQEMEEIGKLVDKIEALPEVVKIYDNIL